MSRGLRVAPGRRFTACHPCFWLMRLGLGLSVPDGRLLPRRGTGDLGRARLGHLGQAGVYAVGPCLGLWIPRS